MKYLPEDLKRYNELPQCFKQQCDHYLRQGIPLKGILDIMEKAAADAFNELM